MALPPDDSFISRQKLRLTRVIAGSTADVPVWRTLRNRILSWLMEAPGIRVGSHIRIDRSHPELGGQLELGSNVEIGAQAILDISGGIHIESSVTVSQGVLILSHDHTIESSLRHWRDQGLVRRHVRISEGAWIGARSVVLGRVGLIGPGAIVGAGSVVSRPVTAMTVVAGNPAAELRRRDS
jgi:acetyltransferase-like isoleucine patch superfamily enzyme